MIRCIKSNRSAVASGETPQALILGSYSLTALLITWIMELHAPSENLRMERIKEWLIHQTAILSFRVPWHTGEMGKMNVIKFNREKQSPALGEEYPACTSIYWDLLICKSAVEKEPLYLDYLDDRKFSGSQSCTLVAMDRCGFWETHLNTEQERPRSSRCH